MPSVFDVLFGMAGLLALVSLLPAAASRLNLPFSVFLAAFGLLLGVAGRLFAGVGDLGPLADFLMALRRLDLSAEAFLLIFLPVLLFETALAIEVQRLIDDLAPILLLAVVAVLFSTILVGVALWQTSPIGLVGCVLLSAIVATTDPAAVIGIFRDIGAPRRLSMLVEGESLLNDAAAIVLFSLALEIVTGGHAAHGPLAGLVAFVWNLAGGGLTGFLAGRLLCLLVTPMRNLPLSEITLTVAFAYLSYIAAEHYLGASGVVAVVATALVVASVGRTRISPETWTSLEQVWRQLGFWATSLVFVIAGMMVPPILNQVRPAEIGLLAVVIAAALGARALVLFGMLPLLTAVGLGQRVSHAYKTVILWGGLRGAVSLALAFSVTENLDVPPEIQRFVAVLATGFVLFTLFVNGTTLRPLIHLLGLDALPRVERTLRRRALALVLTNLRENVETLARDYRIDPEVAARTARTYDERLAEIDRLIAAEPELSAAERVDVGLLILVSREEELYLEHFREGIISRAIVEALTERVGWLHDGLKAQGIAGYEAEVRRAIGFSRRMLWALRLQRRLGLRGPLAKRLAARFEGLLINRMVLLELDAFTRRRLKPMLGAGTCATLTEVLARRLKLVEQALASLRLRYPNHAPVLQHQYLGRAALRREEAEYRLMRAESLISAEVLADLKRDLERRWRALDRAPDLDLGLDLPDLIARVPLFAGLGEERLAEIAHLLRMRLALPDEVLLRRGDRGGAMYFIASGSVEVVVPGYPGPVQLGAGDFFGEISLLTREPRTADVKASCYCHLLELSEPDFRHLIEHDRQLRDHILSVAGARREQRQAAIVAL